MKLYNRLKKRLAMAVVATTAFTSVGTPVFAADYETHWAAEAIAEWKNKGVINGYEDGTFKPKQNITRAELATMLVKIFGLTETKGAKTFADVKEGDWYAETIAKVSAADIMYVEGTNFKPNRVATREEAAYALAKAYKVTGSTSRSFEDQAQISDWSEDAIAALVSGGYLSGRPDGTFAPKDALTRADMVTMIDKITAQLYNQNGTYNQDVTGNVVVNAQDVELKDMTINGNLYITEGVGNGDVTLDNVVVTGEVFVEGGGLNSIKLKGKTSVGKLTVNKVDGKVRIVTSGEAKVNKVIAQSGATLEGNFNEVQVANAVKIDVLANSTIGKLTVDKAAKGLNLKLAAGATIKEAIINATVTITGNGKIVTVTLSAGLKASDVSIKVTVENFDGNSSNSGGSSGSSSSGGSSSSDSETVSSYSVRGQLTLDGQVVQGIGIVKLLPYTLDQYGNSVVDKENAKTIETDKNGAFDFGKVAKNKKYKLIAEYENYESVYLIEKLNSNKSIEMELEERLYIKEAEVIDATTIELITNNVGSLKGSVDGIDGIYKTSWTNDKEDRIVTIEIPEGKKLEANKTYTVRLQKSDFESYVTTSVVYVVDGETPETPDTPEAPDTVLDGTWELPSQPLTGNSIQEVLTTAGVYFNTTDGVYTTDEIDWKVTTSGGYASLSDITTTGTYTVVGTVTHPKDTNKKATATFTFKIECTTTGTYTLTVTKESEEGQED